MSTDPWAEVSRLRREVASLDIQNAALHRDLRGEEELRKELQAEVAALTAERDGLAADRDSLAAKVGRTGGYKAERDAALEKSAFWHCCYMSAISKRFEGTGL